MNARDDYPLLVNEPPTYSYHDMLDQRTSALNEIDALRRWKAEAIEVITRWDAVAEHFDMPPGVLKSEWVGQQIAHNAETLDEMRALNANMRRADSWVNVQQLCDRMDERLDVLGRQLVK